jgi:hypothetical protein
MWTLGGLVYRMDVIPLIDGRIHMDGCGCMDTVWRWSRLAALDDRKMVGLYGWHNLIVS